MWRLHHHPADADLVPMATAICAEAVARVIGAGAADRLGTCGADECERVFLDGSKNGSRRFCSTTCQNRVKALARRRHGADRPCDGPTAGASSGRSPARTCWPRTSPPVGRGTVRRTHGAPEGGTSTSPPSFAAFAAVASASSTAKVTPQCGVGLTLADRVEGGDDVLEAFRRLGVLHPLSQVRPSRSRKSP